MSRLTAREHHLPAAVFAVVAVALLVGLPEVLDQTGRLAAVLVLQLGLVLCWVLVTGVQGFAGSLAVGAGAAVAADLALVLPEEPELGSLLAVFGIGFLAAVLQQMLRRPRHDVVAHLSCVVLLLVAVASLGSLLLLGGTEVGSERALVALSAVGVVLVVGHLVDLVVPRPQLVEGVPRGLLSLGVAVLAGTAAAFLVATTGNALDGQRAVVHGLVIGGVAALSAVVASYLVVETTAEPDGDRVHDDGLAEDGPPGELIGDPDEIQRWSALVIPVIQVALPVAACAPVALALQSVL